MDGWMKVSESQRSILSKAIKLTFIYIPLSLPTSNFARTDDDGIKVAERSFGPSILRWNKTSQLIN